MATFNVGIGKDDIQEGVLLPEDWYTMELSRDPYEDKNSHWKEAGEGLSLDDAIKINPKCGKNIIVHLKVISEIPEYNGRAMTKWLSLPHKYDEGQHMNDGQPKADWKASVIHKWVEAFGGLSEGAEVSFAEGQKALVYVITEKDRQDEQKLINAISMNVDPRAIGAGGALTDENPFEAGGLL